jgi:hypothetical protein
MTYDNKNNLNSIGGDQPNNKKKPEAPTIGDAVKEAVEAGKEVVMEGPTNAGDITGISTDNIINANEHGKINKEIVDGIAMSLNNEDDSKIAIETKEPNVGTALTQNKIIIDSESTGETKEVAVATLTTIPTENGIDVEVQTEVEVPIEDKDKEIGSESKLNVKTANLSTTIPIVEDQSSQSPSASELHLVKEVIPIPTTMHNPTVQQQSSNDGLLTEPTVGTTRSIDVSVSNISKNPNANDALQTDKFKHSKDIVGNYSNFQDQTRNHYQFPFIPILNNANNVFLTNQALCTRLLEIYSRSSFIYMENAMSLVNMMSKIFATNIFAYDNFFNYSRRTLNK